MSELARSIVGRLRSFIRDRRGERRRSVHLPVSVSLINLSAHRNGARGARLVDGHTHDISANGLSLIVPVIRIGENYLTGEDRRLQVRLELPVGPVDIEASPVRYERLEERSDESGYLIGVRIRRMSEGDRARYREYLKSLLGK